MSLELAAVCNLDWVHRLVHPVRLDTLNLLDHIHALKDLSKDHCTQAISF